jgi:hypothetical protein
MALTIRNTFFHLSQHEDEQQPQFRSNSAPPTCRQTKRDKGDYDSADYSTSCETLEFDGSTLASDLEDDIGSRRSSCTEHEELSPPQTSRRSDSDEHDAQPLESAPGTISQEAAQEQLDAMSQKVMDLWSKLRSIESSLATGGEDIVDPTAAGPAAEAPPVCPSERSSAKHSRAAPAHNHCRLPTEVQSVLASTRGILTRIPGVTNVDVNLGTPGALSTITVSLNSCSSKPSLVASVLSTTKSALLDLAANSQTVYVMGYEAQPFQDERDGSGFATVLAIMPLEWECSACWDVYQKGSCHRRKTCKWQHPGRNQLQPLRIVVC